MHSSFMSTPLVTFEMILLKIVSKVIISFTSNGQSLLFLYSPLSNPFNDIDIEQLDWDKIHWDALQWVWNAVGCLLTSFLFYFDDWFAFELVDETEVGVSVSFVLYISLNWVVTFKGERCVFNGLKVLIDLLLDKEDKVQNSFLIYVFDVLYSFLITFFIIKYIINDFLQRIR